ncbi:hypothetical protein H3H54_13885 [Brachybacterium sp. Z12]|uniref:hypothetical protein n=1 Tax=Brachybacterium sp. Z12 TaxID=2759167 RepID=UPI001862BC38|nr:hypothetical protein [Brachybacterium sp. Z12]QNN82198.1 hypothetical protein H3H54_13885 [Brachybacterium sp. Z12]
MNQELERQGLPPLVVHFEDLSEDGLGGYWIEFDIFRPWRGEHIVIDLETAKDPWAVNVAAHEARHAAQDQWIEETEGPSWWQFWAEDGSAAEHERIEREHDVTPEEIDAWRENDKDYQPAPGPQPGRTRLSPSTMPGTRSTRSTANSRWRRMPSTPGTSSPRRSPWRSSSSISRMPECPSPRRLSDAGPGKNPSIANRT